CSLGPFLSQNIDARLASHVVRPIANSPCGNLRQFSAYRRPCSPWLCRRLHRLGFHLSGHEGWHRVLPTPPPGWHSPPHRRAGPLSHPALEDRRTSRLGTVAYRDRHWLFTPLRWQRRRLRCRTNCALGRGGLARRNRLLVDGYRRLASSRRRPARSSYPHWH